jgi:hypothetical protein
MKTKRSDFTFINEGTIILLCPETPKALNWIENNLSFDS